MDLERASVELSEFAADGGVATARATRTREHELIETHGRLPMSLWSYVPHTETAEGNLTGAQWAAVGAAMGRLHSRLATHPAAAPTLEPGAAVCDVAAARDRFDFIAREALATRLKKGDAAAYEFLGYPSDPPVELSPIRLESNQLRIGDRLVFAADMTAAASTKVRVNYVISSPTKTGKRRLKAYALKTAAVEVGQTIELGKQHALKSTATVTIIPGTYAIEIQVNGRSSAPVEFTVVE